MRFASDIVLHVLPVETVFSQPVLSTLGHNYSGAVYVLRFRSYSCRECVTDIDLYKKVDPYQLVFVVEVWCYDLPQGAYPHVEGAPLDHQVCAGLAISKLARNGHCDTVTSQASVHLE